MNPIHSNILFIIFAFNIYFGDALRICIPNIIGRCVISNHNKRSKEEYTNIKKHRHHLNSAKDNDIHNWEYKRYSSDFIVSIIKSTISIVQCNLLIFIRIICY